MAELITTARKGFMKLFNKCKVAVVVRDVTEGWNAQDDMSLTVNSTYSTYAKVDSPKDSDLNTSAGRLPDADMVMYFPWSFTSGLTKGNYITFDSTNYLIKDIYIPRLLGGAKVYIKVYLKESNVVF